MKRPLLNVAWLYAGGILLADILVLPLAGLLGVGLFLSAAALAWERGRPWLLVALLVLLGWANAIFHSAVLSPHDLRCLLTSEAAEVEIRGTLRETPVHRFYFHDEEERWRSVAIVRVLNLRPKGGNWQPAEGSVLATTPGVLPARFFAGETIEVSGVIVPPELPIAAGLFNYRAHLAGQGIAYQLRVESTNDWRLPSPSPAPPWSERFATWAKATIALGLPREDESLQLLWAMTLGWKTALSGEVSEPFMRSGTMHIFAISGLHIALISGILVALLRMVRMPRRVCGVIVIPALWAYTAITGWQASAVRSTVMMTVVILGWAIRRPSDLLNSLMAAAFLLLLWDPRQLFQAGFQLSFCAVLSLALFVPVLEKIRLRWVSPDPWRVPEDRSWWQCRRDDVVNYLTTSVVTSLAAWLGTIPLVAWYFHWLTPVSLLANMIVVPLSSAALASNLASLLVGAWWPWLAEVFNHGAWFWMTLMIRVSEGAAHLPGGSWSVGTPSWTWVALYYLALVSFMAGWLVRPRVRVWAGLGLVLLAAASGVEWARHVRLTSLTVLPLHGGAAAYFDAPGSRDDLLVDCGDEGASDFVTKPFLRARGVNRLPGFVLTHGDIRHVGGAEHIAELFPPRRYYLSAVNFRSSHCRLIRERLRDQTDRVHIVQCGERIGSWEVLHPSATDQFPQADDNALVLRGSVGPARVLLLSDLGKPGQNRLMERHSDLRADIVIAGLPANSEPLADALIEAIQPRVIVIVDANYPATARASPRLRSRLNRHGAEVIYTREAGAVTITGAGSSYQVTTAHKLRALNLAP